MPENGNDEVIQIVGNVGGEPEQRDGSEYINFSVAVTKSYANKITTWVRVGTKNPDLVQFVKDNIHKSTPVACEGFMKVDSYNGKPQYNLLATRIGTVTYAVRKTSSTSQQQSSEAAQAGFSWK